MNLIELEKSAVPLAVICWRTPVWCFTVYETGEAPDWFAPSPLGRLPVRIGGVVINNVSYTNATAITEVDDVCQLKEEQFCQIGNTVYVVNRGFKPLWLHLMPKYNAVIGFTDGAPFAADGIFYRAGLDRVPSITDKADDLEYGRMAFRSEGISLINTKGDYDDVLGYFGNSVRVRSGRGGVIRDLCEYYVKDVEITSGRTTFLCGDRRERLSQKVPGRKFTREEFPKIREDLVGETMQDVYGRCEWVRCVPVDELDIYTTGTTKKQHRTFYASRRITKLCAVDNRDPDAPTKHEGHVWVKMTQPDERGSKEIWTLQKADSVDHANGTFTLAIGKCMPTSWSGNDVPDLFEVRASGWFNAQNTPLEIIKELLDHYCDIRDDDYAYDRARMQEEIGGLAPVGVVYDREVGIYEAIERLQDASDRGFQFKTDYNRFTAVRDDDGRPVSATIRIADIVDIGKARIKMNREKYATIVDVPYSRMYYRRPDQREGEDSARHHLGTANRRALLAVHGVDRTYASGTYLADPEDPKDGTAREAARGKAERLEKFFKRTRPTISGLQVLNHPDLRVYDIVEVDLRIPLERRGELMQVAVLFGGSETESVVFGDWPGTIVPVDFVQDPGPAYRAFGGVLRCKVMGVSLDAGTMVNTLTLLEVGD